MCKKCGLKRFFVTEFEISFTGVLTATVQYLAKGLFTFRWISLPNNHPRRNRSLVVACETCGRAFYLYQRQYNSIKVLVLCDYYTLVAARLKWHPAWRGKDDYFFPFVRSGELGKLASPRQ